MVEIIEGWRAVCHVTRQMAIGRVCLRTGRWRCWVRMLDGYSSITGNLFLSNLVSGTTIRE